MIDEIASRTHRENPRALGESQSPQAPAGGARLEWLFRETLRRKQVHPLMELLRRYRSQEGA